MSSGNALLLRLGGVVFPSNLVLPIISGDAVEGVQLNTTNGEWNVEPSGYAYQWKGDGVAISGATSASYTLQFADVGTAITVTVTATLGFVSTPVTSAATVAVANAMLASLDLRATSGFVTDPARSTYLVTADIAAGTITRGGYTFQALGSITAADTDNTVTPILAGRYSVTGTSGKVRVAVTPNIQFRVRLGLGAYSSSTAVGCSVYDGDPGAGGALLFTVASVTPATNQVADATGALMSAPNWAALNAGVLVTSTTGSLYIVRIIGGTPPAMYLRHIVVEYPIEGTATTGTGPFYVNAATGDDNNDGLTTGTAWQHLPGDPGAGGVVAYFVPQPTAVVNLEGGQRYRGASFGTRTTFLTPALGGTDASHRVTYRTRPGSGANAIICGDELQPSGWTSASGDVFGASAAAIAEKLTLAAPVAWSQFICAGDAKFYGAQYPQPSDKGAIDNTDSGNDGFIQYNSTFSTARVTTTGSGPYTTTITDPLIAARYAGLSLVGYIVAVRRNGNWLEENVITAHNSGTGAITYTSVYRPFAATSTADFMFAIRYHPKDLNVAGQYAFSADTLTVYATFGPTLTGDRSIVRYNVGIDMQVSYMEFGTLDFQRFAGPTYGTCFRNDTVAVSGWSLHDMRLSQLHSPNRDAAIFMNRAGGSVMTLDSIVVDEAVTQSAIRMPLYVQSTATNITGRKLGRTGDYIAGSNGNKTTAFISAHQRQYIRTSNNSSTHGNGETCYQEASNNVFQNFESMNHVNPLTMQTDQAVGGSTFTRNNTFKNFVTSGKRTFPGTPSYGGTWKASTNYAIRIDGNETGSQFEGFIAVIAGSAGMLISAGCTGMTVKNAVLSALNTASTGTPLTGVSFENVIILGTTSSIPNLAAITTKGGTVIGNVAFSTHGAWNGCITQEMQEVLTHNIGGAGYTARTIGLAWAVPAYGSAFALADCAIDELSVSVGQQALLCFASIINTQPIANTDTGCSLPATGDNALFGLVNGQVFFQSAAVAGSYSLTIRQTSNHPDRTGSATKDTAMTVTVA